MSKIQELNQAHQSLSAECHQRKMQFKEQLDKNNHLEHVLAGGEVKLRNMARQLVKAVEEQQRLLRVEADLRMEIKNAQYGKTTA